MNQPSYLEAFVVQNRYNAEEEGVFIIGSLRSSFDNLERAGAGPKLDGNVRGTLGIHGPDSMHAAAKRVEG